MTDTQKVQVPSNYDEATQTYAGDWDGTFIEVTADNPAWLLYKKYTKVPFIKLGTTEVVWVDAS